MWPGSLSLGWAPSVLESILKCLQNSTQITLYCHSSFSMPLHHHYKGKCLAKSTEMLYFADLNSTFKKKVANGVRTTPWSPIGNQSPANAISNSIMIFSERLIILVFKSMICLCQHISSLQYWIAFW